jgi:hypothetical protein
MDFIRVPLIYVIEEPIGFGFKGIVIFHVSVSEVS